MSSGKKSVPQSRRGAIVVLAFLILMSPAAASPIADALQGEWSGSGRVILANGKTEHIRCHGEGRLVSSNTVEQYFKCASTAKNLNFSTSLHFSDSRVSGSWTAPDRSGTLAGQASAGSIDLRLSSTRGEGNLSATISACRQSLRIGGWSDELKSLSVELRKPC